MKRHYVIEHGITESITTTGPHVYHDIDKAYQVYRWLVNSKSRDTETTITREQFKQRTRGHGLTALDSTGKGRVHVYLCEVTQDHVHAPTNGTHAIPDGTMVIDNSTEFCVSCGINPAEFVVLNQGVSENVMCAGCGPKYMREFPDVVTLAAYRKDQ